MATPLSTEAAKARREEVTEYTGGETVIDTHELTSVHPNLKTPDQARRTETSFAKEYQEWQRLTRLEEQAAREQEAATNPQGVPYDDATAAPTGCWQRAVQCARDHKGKIAGTVFAGGLIAAAVTGRDLMK